MSRVLATALAALLLAVLCACGGAAAPKSVPSFGVALDGFPVTPGMIETAKGSTGLPVRLVLFYAQWPTNPNGPWESPASSLAAIRAAGAAPCLTWEPMSIGEGGREQTIPAARILEGQYDGYIAAVARELKGFGAPVLLRLAHEMNLERYHWGTDKAGYGPESPKLYKGLFRRVADIFRAEGADNVLFVFCPNMDSLPAAPWNSAAAYYPGDAYVDVLGMDGYNWGTSHSKAIHGYDSTFRSFRDIFGPLFTELRQLAPAKPMMVFETASASAGGDKAQWIAEAFETAGEWGLAAVVWFEVDKELDWPLRKNAARDPAPLARPFLSDDPAWMEQLAGRRP